MILEKSELDDYRLEIGSGKIEVEIFLPKTEIGSETLWIKFMAETTNGVILSETVEHAFILKHL